ncbi:isochorismatase family cysteine hydrolase [Actinomycetospora flava]|uniref:Isochorismatase family cysteine hydrolase n=1 Tax=Actinomycetospora flava TaxID=3129232 RepID=A0ABU8MG40_9PSEU
MSDTRPRYGDAAIDIQSAVLVVVDVQNGFVTPNSDPVVAPIVELVDRWQRAGGATVFTRYLNYEGSPFERLIHWSKLQTSPETDFDPRLAPYTEKSGAHRVDKTIYSLFSEEGTALVESQGWSDLLICGIATESCVLKTAVDAFELGLRPWVLSDAVASHAGEFAHDAGLLVASRFIGRDQVVTSADALERLQLTVG